MGTIEDWGRGFGGRVTSGTAWPAGQYVVAYDRLRQLLAIGARHHARRAVSGYVSDELVDLLDAAVSCGSAMELMAKAVIATTAPALLVDRGSDRDSLLHLTGHGGKAAKAATQLRSVGALEALNLARHLHKELPVVAQDPLPLRVRNSATHMALVEQGELRAAVVHMAQMISAALPILDLDAGLFWGEYAAGAVESLLDEARSETARVVQAKVAAARERYQALLAPVPGELRRGVLAAMATRHFSYADHEQQATCPVCENNGWLSSSIDVGEPEMAYDWKDEPVGMVRYRTALSIGFDCPSCGLDLQGDELAEFDLAGEFDLEPEDVDDNDWEPDEDWVRGR